MKPEYIKDIDSYRWEEINKIFEKDKTYDKQFILSEFEKVYGRKLSSFERLCLFGHIINGLEVGGYGIITFYKNQNKDFPNLYLCEIGQRGLGSSPSW